MCQFAKTLTAALFLTGAVLSEPPPSGVQVVLFAARKEGPVQIKARDVTNEAAVVHAAQGSDVTVLDAPGHTIGGGQQSQHHSLQRRAVFFGDDKGSVRLVARAGRGLTKNVQPAHGSDYADVTPNHADGHQHQRRPSPVQGGESGTLGHFPVTAQDIAMRKDREGRGLGDNPETLGHFPVTAQDLALRKDREGRRLGHDPKTLDNFPVTAQDLAMREHRQGIILGGDPSTLGYFPETAQDLAG